MAIKIRKKVEKNEPTPVVNPADEGKEVEVLDAGGSSQNAPEIAVQIPDEAKGDRFMRTSGSIFKWIEQHSRQIILFCVLALAIFGICYGIYRSNVAKEEEKSSLLSQTIYAYESPTKEQAEQFAASQRESTKKSIGANKENILQYSNPAPNNEIRHKAIAQSLKESRPSVTDSPIVNMVDLMAAGSASKLGKLDEAKAEYERLSKGGDQQFKANDDVQFFALLSEAEIQVQENKLDDAIKSYEMIGSLGDLYYGSYATLKIAQLYEMKNEPQKAVDAYASIISKYPTDVQAQATALRRLKLLTPDWQAKIAAPAAAPSVAAAQ